MSEFKYEIGDRVRLVESGEEGEVIARAQYRSMTDNYLIIYKAADDRQCEAWWSVETLEDA